MWPRNESSTILHILQLVSSLFVYYIHFCMFPWVDCSHLSYQKYWIFKHIMFSNFVFVLCRLETPLIGLTLLFKIKKKRNFSTHVGLVVIKTYMLFYNYFSKIPSSSLTLIFFLSLSQICASSVRSVNLSVPTSLTASSARSLLRLLAYPNQYNYLLKCSNCQSVWFYQQELLMKTHQRHFEQSKKAKYRK